ncbi:hypothetical protein V500_05514, partial [Pseudogymnoascus sp. VKM F-4518 (FW-2643)]
IDLKNFRISDDLGVKVFVRVLPAGQLSGKAGTHALRGSGVQTGRRRESGATGIEDDSKNGRPQETPTAETDDNKNPPPFPPQHPFHRIKTARGAAAAV